MWELHNLSLNQVGAHAGNGPWDDDLHHVENEYLEKGGEFLVGTTGNKIVCMGALLKKSGTTAEIKRMRVHPDYQRRGFGQKMLVELERCASRIGYSHLYVDTTTKQVPAQKLYEKNSYIESGRYDFAGFKVIRYEKNLSRECKAPK
jgi:ribosomal protein S18 acetylase RimI-like enzyme